MSNAARKAARTARKRGGHLGARARGYLGAREWAYQAGPQITETTSEWLGRTQNALATDVIHAGDNVTFGVVRPTGASIRQVAKMMNFGGPARWDTPRGRRPRRGVMQPARPWITLRDLGLRRWSPESPNTTFESLWDMPASTYARRPRSKIILVGRWTDARGVTHARDLATTRSVIPRPSCGAHVPTPSHPSAISSVARSRWSFSRVSPDGIGRWQHDVGNWRLSGEITCPPCFEIVERRLLEHARRNP